MCIGPCIHRCTCLKTGENLHIHVLYVILTYISKGYDDSIYHSSFIVGYSTIIHYLRKTKLIEKHGRYQHAILMHVRLCILPSAKKYYFEIKQWREPNLILYHKSTVFMNKWLFLATPATCNLFRYCCNTSSRVGRGWGNENNLRGQRGHVFQTTKDANRWRKNTSGCGRSNSLTFFYNSYL